MTTTPSGNPADFEFDIAVSFAGEQRAFVEEVVRHVGLPEGRVFYDADFKADMWGEDLIEYFTDVYMNKARYVVMFVSKEYAEKEWTSVERRTSLARAMRQRGAYILPIRLDNTQLDEVAGLLSTIGYLEAIREGIPGIVTCIQKKLAKARSAADALTSGEDDEAGATDTDRPNLEAARIADTPEALQELFNTRPPAWEFLIYASVLKQRRDALETQRRDYEIAYGAATGETVRDPAELRELAVRTLHEVEQTAETFNKLLAPEAFSAAFGEPGTPGDAERILHLGQRFMDQYERFLQIAARVRGVAAPSAYAAVVEACAKLVDSPLAGLEDFFADYISLVRGLPERLVAGENVHVTLLVRLHMDNAQAQRLVDLLNDVDQSE